MSQRWYTVEQVCEELGVSRSTFDKWRARGIGPRALRLPNGSLRVEQEDLEAWVINLPEAS